MVNVQPVGHPGVVLPPVFHGFSRSTCKIGNCIVLCRPDCVQARSACQPRDESRRQGKSEVCAKLGGCARGCAADHSRMQTFADVRL